MKKQERLHVFNFLSLFLRNLKNFVGHSLLVPALESPQSHIEITQNYLVLSTTTKEPTKTNKNHNKVPKNSASTTIEFLDLDWNNLKYQQKWLLIPLFFLFCHVLLLLFESKRGCNPEVDLLCDWLEATRWLLRLSVASLVTTEGRCEARAKQGGIFVWPRRTCSAFPDHNFRATSVTADQRTISGVMTQRRNAKNHPKKGGFLYACPPPPPTGVPPSRLPWLSAIFKIVVLPFGLCRC